jgi:hypothetical protein
MQVFTNKYYFLQISIMEILKNKYEVARAHIRLAVDIGNKSAEYRRELAPKIAELLNKEASMVGALSAEDLRGLAMVASVLFGAKVIKNSVTWAEDTGGEHLFLLEMYGRAVDDTIKSTYLSYFVGLGDCMALWLDSADMLWHCRYNETSAPEFAPKFNLPANSPLRASINSRVAAAIASEKKEYEYGQVEILKKAAKNIASKKDKEASKSAEEFDSFDKELNELYKRKERLRAASADERPTK